MTTVDIDIQQKLRSEIAHTLSTLLADTFILYTKTLNFHWNIEDPRFVSIHQFLEKQYEALAEMNDEYAERIRMLGFKTPASMKQFLELTSLEEDESSGKLSGDEMLKNLLKDHESIIKQLREGIKQASQAKDEGTADLFIKTIQFHEKSAWMLRSQL